MNLIGILLALALEYSLSHWPEWRNHHWYQRLISAMRSALPSSAFWNSPLALLLLLVPVPLAVIVVDRAAESVSPILGVAWAVLVLVLCLGPRDLGEEVQTYAVSFEDNDARAAVEEDLRTGIAELRRRNAPPAGLVPAVIIQGHERLLGVLLWFFVLGPLGACSYRILTMLPGVTADAGCGSALQEAARRFHDIAAWLPARCVALGYALAGSGDDAFSRLTAAKGKDSAWRDHTWEVLANTGCAALREEDADACSDGSVAGVAAANALVRRALFILLAVFSLFTVGGWIA